MIKKGEGLKTGFDRPLRSYTFLRELEMKIISSLKQGHIEGKKAAKNCYAFSGCIHRVGITIQYVSLYI